MRGRTLALGDIHGCSAALDAVLDAAGVGPWDTLITLGDAVDRGPDSSGVIDRLIGLRRRCGHFVPLRGNHDKMFRDAIESHRRDPHAIAEGRYPPGYRTWSSVGGAATVASYGGLDRVPDAHLGFLRGLPDTFETDTHVFVHASYDPDLAIADQPEDLALWASLREHVPGPHRSGKVAVVGHTAQRDGEVLDLGHLFCIDTYCYGGGWLTLLDVHSRDTWQADMGGRLR